MKVAINTLGCKVNQYESEAIADRFRRRGYEIVGSHDCADIYIINTCTVTSLADRKSRRYIRQMKKNNPDAVIAVTGCYVQLNPDEAANLEGVNIIAGTNEKANLADYVEEYIEQGRAIRCVRSYGELGEYVSDGIVTEAEGRTRAYIKIQEGCNRFCSYCVIPYARGAVRSRCMDEVIEEAESLLSKGYRELVLTGINTALYGIEWDDNLHMHELIEKINSLKTSDFRIRLSSLEPTVVDAEYVGRLLGFDKLCHHMHLSLQSGSNRVLHAMNRRYDREDYLNIVDVLKSYDPDYGITTDIIVGFPGETDEDFSESLDMVNRVGFGRVHSFRYSLRSGTAAARIKDQISAPVKKERAERLSAAASGAAMKFFARSIGKIRTVLIEEWVDDVFGGAYKGYTDNYIKVYISSSAGDAGVACKINKFYDVRMTGMIADGMKGEII